jgi:hypothetical protein
VTTPEFRDLFAAFNAHDVRFRPQDLLDAEALERGPAGTP